MGINACISEARWSDEGLPPLVVSVNLSAALLTDEGLAEHLQSCLRANRVDPARLELELTESQLMEHAADSGRLLQNLKALGVLLSAWGLYVCWLILKKPEELAEVAKLAK